MLKETFFNQYKGWGEKIPPNAQIINVMRTHGSVLAPSYDLLNDWKGKKISWDEYTRRFIQEMQGNNNAQLMIKEIREQCKTKDIYLVCACHNSKKQCHRFLLMDMINEEDDIMDLF